MNEKLEKLLLGIYTQVNQQYPAPGSCKQIAITVKSKLSASGYTSKIEFGKVHLTPPGQAEKLMTDHHWWNILRLNDAIYVLDFSIQNQHSWQLEWEQPMISTKPEIIEKDGRKFFGIHSEGTNLTYEIIESVVTTF